MPKELQELVNCTGRILGTSEDKFIDIGALIQGLGITVLAEHQGVVLIVCWILLEEWTQQWARISEVKMLQPH